METNTTTLTPILTAAEKFKTSQRLQPAAPAPQVVMPEKSVASNVLGSLAGRPGPSVIVSLATVAKRYREQIVKDIDLGSLLTAQEKVKAERAIQAEHSAVSQAEQIKKASTAYAARPCVETQETLRHLRSLSDHDNTRARELSRFRIREVMKGVSPILKQIYRQAAKAALQEAAERWSGELQTSAAFKVEASPTPITSALFMIGTNLENVSRATCDFSEWPELPDHVLDPI